ncbi:unnamed protein product [Cuscuta europaea]|uniref:RNase H type-1 domain-containing protein n=1 Tax=Cuscuta europaea TaxID=41803 RepID=A0A9P0ZU21_CUSEU|nr:unnamed protein product [Cuscuta europaea]
MVAWELIGWSWSASPAQSFLEQIWAKFEAWKEDDLCMLVWVCWGLWCELNNRTWNGVISDPKQILVNTRMYLDGWRLAQQPVGRESNIGRAANSAWRKPSPVRYKLNVDAAVREKICGLGWVLRNDAGNFVTGVGKAWHGVLSPLEAELIGIREALSWMKERGWDCIQVESDSSGAVTEVLQESSVSLAGIGDIREISSGFTDISFSHIRWSANRATHELAKVACSMPDCIYWDDLPPFTIHVLNSDSLNDS